MSYIFNKAHVNIHVYNILLEMRRHMKEKCDGQFLCMIYIHIQSHFLDD